jgi:hypothetical protein
MFKQVYKNCKFDIKTLQKPYKDYQLHLSTEVKNFLLQSVQRKHHVIILQFRFWLLRTTQKKCQHFVG